MSNFGAQIHNSQIKKSLSHAMDQFETAKNLLSLESLYELEQPTDSISRPWLKIRDSRVHKQSVFQVENVSNFV